MFICKRNLQGGSMKLLLIILFLSIFQPVTSDTNMITINLEPEKMQLYANYKPLQAINDGYGYRYAKLTNYAPSDNKSGICADSDPTKTSTMKTPGREYA